ncbi:MAG: glycosyltransferase [Alphaproteobacteria bacterium]|nr:glycosyltransferase [Alphaproteobacteria bacterium]
MKKPPKLIVSITSFPAAIPIAAQAIRSIFKQSIRPDKIVLYLTSEQFPGKKLPVEIKALQKESKIFEVRFCDENIKSYTKLIPALKDFPNDMIITIDDDVIYPRSMISQLTRRHKKYPNAIVGLRVKRVRFGEDGRLLPHRQWKNYKTFRFLWLHSRPRLNNQLMGVSGVLYPPRVFPPQVFDSNTFMKIAPTVDDIWFWLMAVKKGTKTTFVPWGSGSMHLNNARVKGMGKPKSITLTFQNFHCGKDVNLESAERIFKKYPDIEKKLKTSLNIK